MLILCTSSVVQVWSVCAMGGRGEPYTGVGRGGGGGREGGRVGGRRVIHRCGQRWWWG